MYQLHGTSTRDGLWSHPDLLPSAEDLDDPMGFAAEHGAAQGMQMPELDDPDLATFKPAYGGGDAPAEAAKPAFDEDTPSTGSEGHADPPSSSGESPTDPPSSSGESHTDSSGS